MRNRYKTLNFTLIILNIIIIFNLFLSSFCISMVSTGKPVYFDKSNFNDTYITSRGNSSTDSKLVFLFNDEKEDVWVTEDKLENYTTSAGFDIKSISSEVDNNSLWLNMTMHDAVYDDERIYYRLKAGGAEAILYRGDGSITYPDKTAGFSIWYTVTSISANIDLEKVNLEAFSISALVSFEDSNKEYGDYVIYDDVYGELNGFEQSYQDPQNDVKIAYTQSHLEPEKGEIDILQTKLEDHHEVITITITLGSEPQSGIGFSYTLTLGDAEFQYSDGKCIIHYANEAQNDAEFTKISDSISVDLKKSKLNFLVTHIRVTTKHEPSERKIFLDEDTMELPGYFYRFGEKMDLKVNLFKNDQIILLINDKLNISNTIALRELIDSQGNNDAVVETSEVESFIEQLQKDFTTEDMFEFYPLVDSVPGEASIEFEFENATGAITNQKTILQSITGRWQFLSSSAKEHNVTFKLISEAPYISSTYAFFLEIVYNNVMFKFSDEFKYWEITPNTTNPELLKNYINARYDMILIPDLEYYVLKNRLTEPEWGFSIIYNETLANLDKENKKSDDPGFIPGFEVGFIIMGVVMYTGYYILSRKD